MKILAVGFALSFLPLYILSGSGSKHEQPSQNVSVEQVILKLEAVWVGKGTLLSARRARACRGVRGHPPWKIFEI